METQYIANDLTDLADKAAWILQKVKHQFDSDCTELMNGQTVNRQDIERIQYAVFRLKDTINKLNDFVNIIPQHERECLAIADTLESEFEKDPYLQRGYVMHSPYKGRAGC